MGKVKSFTHAWMINFMQGTAAGSEIFRALVGMVSV